VSLGASSLAVERQEASSGRSAAAESEEDAVQRLIAEIDSIEDRQDRVGRRIVVLFVATFAGAAVLLVWSAMHAQDVAQTPGPRVPAVTQSERAPVR